jgi:hypothetical protein
MLVCLTLSGCEAAVLMSTATGTSVAVTTTNNSAPGTGTKSTVTVTADRERRSAVNTVMYMPHTAIDDHYCC